METRTEAQGIHPPLTPPRQGSWKNCPFKRKETRIIVWMYS